jgi:hypothetical protein
MYLRGLMRRFSSHFVPWGRRAAVDGNKGHVRKALREKYRPLLADAGFLRRLWLHFRMMHEFRREIARLAPREGLYSFK